MRTRVHVCGRVRVHIWLKNELPGGGGRKEDNKGVGG